jgi:hypothetical protein
MIIKARTKKGLWFKKKSIGMWKNKCKLKTLKFKFKGIQKKKSEKKLYVFVCVYKINT